MMKPVFYHNNARLDVINLIPDRRFQRILEIGGGDFPTLRQIGQTHDAEIWGVDIRPPEVALEKFVLGSITNEQVNRQLPNDYFDLVMANDVIEHIEDTKLFFRVIHDKLQAGGTLALSVPNIRQVRTAYHVFFRGTFPRHDAGLFDRTHLRWFCKKDVIELAKNVGFSLEACRGSGRLVPDVLASSALAEFLALQNLFIFIK
jgi:2-polyprenyl-3-methyl-5-hydroxy-6-metoxy-1,4-benzoquinol methylase